MSNKIHLVMPMAGLGSRFSKEGFDFPKPLIRIKGKPFFYWATESIRRFLDLESIDFVVLKKHVNEYKIDETIKDFYPDARLHVLNEVTEGAVITCMNGIEYIEDEYPIVFNDCDHMFKSSKFNEFIENKGDDSCEGLLLTFISDEPKYSFVEKNEAGNVIRTVEKEVISNEAICGCYYFKNKEIFLRASNQYLKECNYSEFFMSGVYNVLLHQNYVVKSVPTDFHVSFGVPEEYEEAKDSEYFELFR